jgi:hypothetical protein
MPVVESSVVVPVTPDVAFAVSQLTGEVRMRWDVFLREQRLLDGATVPGVGVRTLTISRRGLRVVSEYVSYRPPTSVGMKVTELPWFFDKLGGGWRFAPHPDGTLATWKYNFSCRPAWLAPLAEWIGSRLIRHDMDRRIAGFARGCVDPVVVAAARARLES